MRSRLWLALLLLPLAALAAVPAASCGDRPKDQAAPASDITWQKIVVDRKFRSEGVAVADVNNDGRMDVLTGEWWFEAPDWKPHAIRKGAVEDYTKGQENVYSNSFCCWVEDFNGDGWPDLLVIGFPGKPCHWYENPQGRDGLWKEHLVADNACNETPQYVDLFGTGKRVLVMGLQPKGKGENGNEGRMVWLRPGPDPTQPWNIYPISGPSDPATKKIVPGAFKFYHGLGVGDINGDGRADVISTAGWWEQPEKGADPCEPWKFHAADLGPACSDMYAFDVDGDGKADVLSSSAHEYGIWWHQQKPGQNGNPDFLRRDLFPHLVAQTHALHFVDINGDGLKDLVTGKRWWAHGPKGDADPTAPAMLYWFEAKRDKDGVTTFTPHEIDNDSGVGTQFTVADFDGDGLPDVITSNKKGTFIFLQRRPKK
jgi:hypothetical protein